MFKLIGIPLLLSMALVTSIAHGEGYDYKANGKDYHLDVSPADEESEAIIKKYRLHNIVTSLGNVRSAANKDLAETEIRPIVVGDKIYLRDGYITMSNEDFRKLLKRASKRFLDLKDVPWGAVKSGLTRRDWARPVLKDGEFQSGSFLLHKTILAYWNDVDESALDDKPKKKKKGKRNGTRTRK